jgi:hypothetical protein
MAQSFFRKIPFGLDEALFWSGSACLVGAALTAGWLSRGLFVLAALVWWSWLVFGNGTGWLDRRGFDRGTAKLAAVHRVRHAALRLLASALLVAAVVFLVWYLVVGPARKWRAFAWPSWHERQVFGYSQDFDLGRQFNREADCRELVERMGEGRGPEVFSCAADCHRPSIGRGYVCEISR